MQFVFVSFICTHSLKFNVHATSKTVQMFAISITLIVSHYILCSDKFFYVMFFSFKQKSLSCNFSCPQKFISCIYVKKFFNVNFGIFLTRTRGFLPPISWYYAIILFNKTKFYNVFILNCLK